jgi:hypothetical protein
MSRLKIERESLIKILKFAPFIVLIIVLIFVFFLRSPKTAEQMRADVLKTTPIGMSMEDVVWRANSNRLGIHHIDNEFGYALSGRASWSFFPDEVVVGEKSVRGFFRDSSNPEFPVSGIQIFWGFDENSKLIDVYIWMPVEDDL